MRSSGSKSVEPVFDVDEERGILAWPHVCLDVVTSLWPPR